MSEKYPETNSTEENNAPLSLWEELEQLSEESLEALPEDTKSLLEILESDIEFNSQISILIESLDSGEIQIEELQSKFLLLIRNIFPRLGKDKSTQIKELLKRVEKDISQHVTSVSHYLITHRTEAYSDLEHHIQKPKDKYSFLSKEAKKNMKRLLKLFAIYETYKILNPRRIAGESNRDNFIANYITGGIKRAMKYEKNSKQIINSLSPQLLKTLQKSHNKFAKGHVRMR